MFSALDRSHWSRKFFADDGQIQKKFLFASLFRARNLLSGDQIDPYSRYARN